MTNEEFQKLMLQKMDSIENRIGAMETRIGSMEAKIDSMEAKIGAMETKIGAMEIKIGAMEIKIGAMETKIGAMDEQLDENTQIIKALMHRTEEINAELHNLGHMQQHIYGQVNVLEEKVTKFGEQLYNLADDVSFLVRKAAEHDKAIRRLYPIK
ncbi:MAG: hypothetical protein N2491_04545 [Negativicutes bacterium]|nr:hypothetical protein [Negativicutes bacterium]